GHGRGRNSERARYAGVRRFSPPREAKERGFDSRQERRHLPALHRQSSGSAGPADVPVFSVLRQYKRGSARKRVSGVLRRARRSGSEPKGEKISMFSISKLLLCGQVSLLFICAIAVLADDAKPVKARILVLCTGNSARSQMSAGFL